MVRYGKQVEKSVVIQATGRSMDSQLSSITKLNNDLNSGRQQLEKVPKVYA